MGLLFSVIKNINLTHIFKNGEKMKNNIRESIKEFSRKNIYFSIEDLKRELNHKGIAFKHDTIKRYCYDLKKENVIYDAGKGWYSSLKEGFKLDKEPLNYLAKKLKDKFPFLEFSGWSTAQIKDYFQHIPSIFTIFVYTDRDFFSAIKDLLNKNDYNVYLNPGKREAEKFVEFENKTVILRPFYTPRTYQNDKFASIEKIIVDLFIENKKLNLLDLSEYKKIVANIIFNYRINIPKTFDYAHERKLKRRVKEIVLSLN